MKKRPTDPFKLAKLVGDIATGQVPKEHDKKQVKKENKSKKSKKYKI